MFVLKEVKLTYCSVRQKGKIPTVPENIYETITVKRVILYRNFSSR